MRQKIKKFQKVIIFIFYILFVYVLLIYKFFKPFAVYEGSTKGMEFELVESEADISFNSTEFKRPIVAYLKHNRFPPSEDGGFCGCVF